MLVARHETFETSQAAQSILKFQLSLKNVVNIIPCLLIHQKLRALATFSIASGTCRFNSFVCSRLIRGVCFRLCFKFSMKIELNLPITCLSACSLCSFHFNELEGKLTIVHFVCLLLAVSFQFLSVCKTEFEEITIRTWIYAHAKSFRKIIESRNNLLNFYQSLSKINLIHSKGEWHKLRMKVMTTFIFRFEKNICKVWMKYWVLRKTFLWFVGQLKCC